MTQDAPLPGGETPPASPAVQPAARLAYRPYVSYALIGLCVGVYIAQMVSKSMWGVDVPSVWGIKNNALIMSGQVWRLFTPIFLHGSILHILFNMYALSYLGPSLERFYGHLRFLALFLVAGFAGNVISFMFSPHLSLGSSTAIFGLLGAQGVMIYQNRALFGNIARRALSQVVMIAVVNLLIGLTPGIDNWGHIGGLIGGTLFAWFGGPLLQKQGMYPPYSLADARTRREVILAAAGVAALFIFLTIAAMYILAG